MKTSAFRRLFSALLLCAVFLALLGCEQEIDPALLAGLTNSASENYTQDFTEQGAATHILFCREDSDDFGTLSEYLGRITNENGDFYACSKGYIPSDSVLRVIKKASDSDLWLTDTLWLLPNNSVKLRSTPSRSSDTIALLSSDRILSATAVSCTDALYYAVSTADLYGYISSAGAKVSRDVRELEFCIEMSKYSPVGAQIALIDNGEITASYAYGLADIERGIDMTSDTKIRMASLSKIAFVISAMKLQDEGVVDIDKNIGTYWNGESVLNPAYSDRDITLRNIMSHSSSFKALSSYMSLSELSQHIYSTDAFNKLKPGNANSWEYNNFAVGIGGTALELAAEKTMQAYLDKTMFSAMKINASYGPDALPAESCAILYRPDRSLAREDDIEAVSHSDIPGENSVFFAGGLYISAYDYAKLIKLLVNDGMYDGVKILSRESVEEIEEVQFDLNSSFGFSQCLILRKRDLYDRTLFYHTGNAYGTIAMASYDPQTGDGIVFVATGAEYDTASNGIYNICNDICNKFYTEVL